MRSGLFCATLALMLAGTAERLEAEIFSVVRITDLRGNAAFQVCVEDEKRKIEGALSQEAKVFQKAVEAARDEWNLTHADAAFPSSRIKARTLKVMGTALDREEAGLQLAQVKIREARALAEEKMEEEKALRAKPGKHGRLRRDAVADQKEEVREERERDETADRAELLVRRKLSAAAGHDIPFYGAAEEEPNKKAGRNKKK